ncbi:MAG TPA: hypothetical protein VIQ97_04475 [Prevotella sp.]
MKQKMSYNRIGRLLMNDLLINKRKIVLLTLGTAGVVFIIELLAVAGIVGNADSSFQLFDLTMEQIRAIAARSYAENVVQIVTFVVATRVFSHMVHRHGDIEFLMTPATNSEKWLSRVLYVLLVCLLILFVSYYLGMILCTLLVYMVDADMASMLWNMDSTAILTAMGFGKISGIHVYSLLLTTGSFAYGIFGGTYFRHNAWLYSWLWLIGGVIVVSFVSGIVLGLTGFQGLAAGEGDEGFANFMTSFIQQFMLWSAVAGGVMTVVFPWLSYRIFCRRQLEMNKIKIRKK